MPQWLNSEMRLVARLLLGVWCAGAAAQTHRTVLVISIDGMRPDYVTAAEAHGLRIPTLRALLAEGTHADGVVGVLPTVTYPSHTTLMTGVWPSEHGILNNGRFDPEQKLAGAWFWYAPQIKVPTLWSAAKAAGLRTASVSWPVTVDAADIDTLIPEFWRTPSIARIGENPDDRLMMDAISQPAGEVARLTGELGEPYTMGTELTAAADGVRTDFAVQMLRDRKPQFMTVHLSSLDEEEHLHGPFSAEANADLEALDSDVARMKKQLLANDPAAVLVVVSDHGFAKAAKMVNLGVAMAKAGLITLDDGHVSSWKAYPWPAGGVAAIQMKDAAARPRVRALLERLQADPANGIAAVLDREEAVRRGGFPDAAFVVMFKLGYVAGPLLEGPVVVASPNAGMHGFDPAEPQMRASFFAEGKGIAAGKDLGVVDMRQVAPTLAGLLGAALPTAKEPALDLR